MDFQDKRYVVGIDLGTTNSAVSYVDLQQDEVRDPKKRIKIFKVPQLTALGEFSPVSVLPSFLYIPGEYDVSKDALEHPWKREADLFAGVFARDHGAQLPSRLVSSAKSWLCHARADREAPILPWGSQNVEKISPVRATAEFLRHIRKAWNHFVKDEDLFLENQYTVITVPASFDEAARELTLQAARDAGLSKNLTLLEEPLAAFYAWLTRHEGDWQAYVKPDDLILVCDVGGGTTDFTLISLKASEGSPRFERLAVGDHLILGGDNIDLALARHVASKFPSTAQMTPDRWKTLGYKCREAKERLLDRRDSGDGDESVRITLKGEGRSLISGTLSAELRRSELETILCSGFFPEVDPTLEIAKKPGKAMAEFGLPYEQEPAITRHIAWFLETHRESVGRLLGKAPMPDLILFNGGSLKPSLFQNMIRKAIRKWFANEDEELPRLLDNRDPDLSVALGASYYGLVKQGSGVRVGSGSPRSYYIGIGMEVGGGDGDGIVSASLSPGAIQQETPSMEAAPADPVNGDFRPSNHGRALCVVERGLDEGSTIPLPEMSFEVLTNQPVLFPMFSSSFRSGDQCGDVVAVDDTLTPMAPLKTVVRFGKKGEKGHIPVKIEPEYTEMGSLAMWCRSIATPHRWKLQFQLRSSQSGEADEGEVYEAALVDEAKDLVSTIFSMQGKGVTLPSVVKKLEGVVETPKGRWPLSFLREITDHLIANSQWRELSPDHEARWLNLVGFCIRPGFGDVFDEERIRHLWKVYLKRCQFPKSKQNALEWWVFCRRMAGGLTAGQQRQFFQDISPFLIAGQQQKKRMPQQELTEVWMAAANMERLLVKDKITLARKLLSQLKPGKIQPQWMWALSRFGARELLYGSVDRVVHAKEVEKWVQKIMKQVWGADESIVPAVAQMLRKTGDRTRDVSDEMVSAARLWLEKMGATQKERDLIERVVPMERSDEASMFGESLPKGLILKC